MAGLHIWQEQTPSMEDLPRQNGLPRPLSVLPKKFRQQIRYNP